MMIASISYGEERFIALGMSELHRLLLVVYTQRGDRLRIISARKPHGAKL